MGNQIDTNSLAYIFERDNSFKVCDHSTAEFMWDEIIKSGYKHVSTLDWATYLQWLLNECPNIDEERKSLLTTQLNATNEL